MEHYIKGKHFNETLDRSSVLTEFSPDGSSKSTDDAVRDRTLSMLKTRRARVLQTWAQSAAVRNVKPTVVQLKCLTSPEPEDESNTLQRCESEDP